MDIRQNVLAVLNHFTQPYLAASTPLTFRELGRALEYMRGRWVARLDVDYNRQLRRLAFLCSHVPVNADSLAWIMESKCDTLTRFLLRKLTESGVLRVWAFGSGPGTEMFAVNHQLERAEPGLPEVQPDGQFPRVEFSACDREPGWAPIFARMSHQLAAAYAQRPGPRRFLFDPAPQLLLPPAGPLPDGVPPDFYLINYVLSENPNGMQAALAPVVAAAPADALFVLTDVLRPIGTPIRDGMAFLQGLGLHIEWPRQHEGAFDSCYEYKMHMHENVEWMDPFYTGIKQNHHGWELRRNSDVFWLVASKNTPHPDFPHE